MALGIQFRASIEHHFLDTNGWVYVIADPSLDRATQIIRLKSVTFTRELDNQLWSILSVIFSGQIRELLVEKAIYDLKPEITKLRRKLDMQLTDIKTKQKIDIAIRDDFIGLKQIQLTDKAFEVAVGFDGSANIAVDAINIPVKQ